MDELTSGNGELLVYESDIYLGFNLPRDTSGDPYMPTPPDRDEPISSFYVLPYQIFHPRFYDNARPYLPYIIPDTQWEGMLLDRFWESPGGFPVEYDEKTKMWYLEASLRKLWRTFEEILIHCTRYLIAESNHGLSVDFVPCPFPQAHGYEKGWRKKQLARKQAIRSRDAFIPLMALFSQVITWYPPPVNELDPPPYMTVLYERLERTFADWMLHSALTDFSRFANRVGTFMYPTRVDMNPLYNLIANNVPVWLYLGTNMVVDPEIAWLRKDWLPSKAAIMQAKAEYDRRSAGFVRKPTTNTTSWTNLFRPDEDVPFEAPVGNLRIDPHVKPLYYPKPFFGSGQLYGETMEAFLIRREEENKIFAGEEDEHARKDRLDRIEVARTCPYPSERGNSAIKVFIWVPTNDDNPFLLRKRVTPRRIAREWAGWPNETKRYNSFLNEWDIHPSFNETCGEPYKVNATNAQPDSDSELEEIERVMGKPSLSKPYDLAERGSLELAATLAAADINETYNDPPGNHEYEVTLFMSRTRYPLQRAVQLNYGFIPDPVHCEEMREWLELPQINEKRLKALRGSIAEYDSDLPEGSDGLNSVFCMLEFFLNAVRANDMHLVHRLSDLWDLSVSPLMPKLLIGPLLVRRNHGYDPLIYMLTHSSDDSEAIILPNATSAVHCLRWAADSQTWSLKDISAHLLKYGMGFKRATSTVPLYLSGPLFRHRGLGYRPFGYRGTTNDYLSYKEQVRQLVESRLGRAAPMTGGLIWRLSLDAIGVDAALQAICEDPPTLADPHHIHVTQTRKGSYYDDFLSEHNREVICGLYIVPTRTSEVTNEAHVSWWPQESIFQTSGLWIGYWTAQCETWYQKRLAKLKMNPNKELKTTTEWKDTIKFKRNPVRDLKDANEHQCETFISECERSFGQE